MEKRGISIIFLAVFLIFLISFVSSATCTVTTTACNANNMVMKLSSTENAHGALYNQGTYTTYLCCDFTGTHTCDNKNTVLKLYAQTNSHAQEPAKLTYNEPVCFSTLKCTYGAACDANYPIPMVSMSADDNAHIANFDYYSNKICCAPNYADYCGNGVISVGEVCDDGNTISGDGCSYPTCQIESGWTCLPGDPSACYPNNPASHWEKNGDNFAGGDIAINDILTMYIEDDLELAPGTTLTFQIHDTSGIIASVTGTVDINKVTATYQITQGFLDVITNSGENIYFTATGSSRSVTGSTINVVPKNCILSNARWNDTSTQIAGNPVKLLIDASNCDGKTITFTIKEKDSLLNGDDTITNFDITYGATTAGTWLTIFTDDTDGGQTNPPEYYFEASADSSSVTSGNDDTSDIRLLRINPTIECDNGICQAGENCGTCPQDCGCSAGYFCDSTEQCTQNCILTNVNWSKDAVTEGNSVQLLLEGLNCEGKKICFTVMEKDIVGDDTVNTNPTCINSFAAGGKDSTNWIAEWQTEGFPESNPPEYYFIADIVGSGINNQSKLPNLEVSNRCGDSIRIDPEVCDATDLNGETCEDLNGTGWTGTVSCNPTCNSFVGTLCTPPLECTPTSASWNVATIVEGEEVTLNIQTQNCADNQELSIKIKEDDATFDDNIADLANVIVNSNSATTTWMAEFHDDRGGVLSAEENPPEYYFTVKALNTAHEYELNSNLLTVTRDPVAECTVVSYCSDYTSPETCNPDTCGVGVTSASDTAICSGSFNSETGCWDSNKCTCSWDESSGECKSTTIQSSTCGCGNSIKDTGEECDDGNKNNNDGCTSDCKLVGVPAPCPVGTTLCSDGTCSLNCQFTDTAPASCNYDTVCQSNEGCTCSDCTSEADTCSAGLICNIFNGACCTAIGDGNCNPYCSYIDPDCLGRCGNGFKEKGEECDLGLRNGVTNSGCTSDCEYQILPPPCSEGTTLCSDGTCSLNCFETDKGVACNGVNGCEENEGCGCSDCDQAEDSCLQSSQITLKCSLVDSACCNYASDGYCDSYCAYVDPDCTPKMIGDYPIGTCTYTENGADNCDDGVLIRSLSALWAWDSNNGKDASNPDGNDYREIEGMWYYDPLDFSGLRKSEKCIDVQDTLVCPASVEVSYFGPAQFGIAFGLIILIYLVYLLRKTKKKQLALKAKKRK